MLALRRITTLNMKTNSRNFVTRTKARRGGAGHDDHHGHEHPMWETLPFKKGTVATIVFGGAFVGTGLITFATVFQNWKHGFLGKKH